MSKRAVIRRSAISYVLLVGLPLAALALVLTRGHPAPTGTAPPAPGAAASPFALPNLGILIIQILVILAAARVVGFIFRALRQPQVVGEMAAGLILGPSVFGAVAPATFGRVFPPASFGQLQTLSQLGLLLFMFVIGLEFDPKLMRGRGLTAVITSHASIVLPFVLGTLVALHAYPELAPASVGFTGFALFMGAAMSITAFPVLARILVERKLTQTRIGVVALACAAVDDVSAWCILAAVVIVVRAPVGSSLGFTLVGALVFVLAMLLLVRPLIHAIIRRLREHAELTDDAIAGILFFAFACAWVTERIGIHALFGAFLAGAVVPHDVPFVKELLHKLEDFTVVFLLPLFFAFSGLRTELNSIATEFWITGALVMFCAIAGKLGGSAIAARATGLSWREALALGTLLNTRGLMELVILNVGLDIGVLGRPMFSIMVLMALVTTAMTAPILDLLGRKQFLAAPAEQDR